MERRKRTVFCALAAMVVATALSQVVDRSQNAPPSSQPARPALPAPTPWMA